MPFSSVEETERELSLRDYVPGDNLGVSLFLALEMQRPLFLEGAPGVGKTELARVVSEALGTELIRLQCYEGLDVSQAAYEWNYPRQLLEIQARGASGTASSASTRDLFVEEYLLRRPLLQAIDPAREQPAVLLIDEIDRADEEFESFLLELLSDFQMSVPELGTLKARHRPVVLLTSNRTREVHDALKRRCLYHWIDYPSVEQEIEILRRKVPGVAEKLRRQIVSLAHGLRRADLYKVPGVAETIDWGQALQRLGASELSEELVAATAGSFLKVKDDIERLRGGLAAELLDQRTSEAPSEAELG